MDSFEFFLREPQPSLSLPLTYHEYRAGRYVPDESRPVITVRGRRKWYAPWSRHPDQVYFGMSEAMAFRAQDAMLRFG